MTQQNLIIGTLNGKGGDILFEAFTKIDANVTDAETRLTTLEGEGPNNILYINQESDFPNQDATSIYLDDGFKYQISDSFSHTKQIVFQGGSLSGVGITTTVQLTYLGSGAQFVATTNVLSVKNIVVQASSGKHFNFTGTVPAAAEVSIRDFFSIGCVNVGDFDDAVGFSFINSAAINITGSYGLRFTGTSQAITIKDSFFTGLGSGDIGIDLNTVVSNGITISRHFHNGGAGLNDAASIAISGLASSANIIANNRGRILNSNFTGITAPLQNIDRCDIRWSLIGTPPLADSTFAANTGLTASRTVIISDIGEFVQIDGTDWEEDASCRFTTSTDGVITYDGEFDIEVVAQARATIEKVGGGSHLLELRIVKNATPADFIKGAGSTDNSTPAGVSAMELMTVSNGDTIAAYVANQGGTSNIIVSKCNLIVTRSGSG